MNKEETAKTESNAGVNKGRKHQRVVQDINPSDIFQMYKVADHIKAIR